MADKEDTQRLRSLVSADSVNQSYGTNTTVATNSEQDSNKQPPITKVEAFLHIVRGNFGPGCLGLPHAFSLTGWGVGAALLLVISVQGIYSMALLVTIKQKFAHKTTCRTFQDIAAEGLGRYGRLFVQMCMFTVQSGVCCVYVQLVSSALRSALPNDWGVTTRHCILFMAPVFGALSLLRFIQQLKSLSLIGNVCMVLAVGGTLIQSVSRFVNGESGDMSDVLDRAAHSDLKAMALFTGSMFYAFEGLALVVPVENARQTTVGYRPILVSAMTLVAVIDFFVGVVTSMAYDTIGSGSITEFLSDRNTDNVPMRVLNYLVAFAVMLTFPLQLYPAIEVFNEWTNGYFEEPHSESRDIVTPTRPPYRFLWALPRLGIVVVCVIVSIAVNNVALLMSLFGAFGQTGLSMVPSLVHFALARRGVFKSPFYVFLDVVVVLICAVTMVCGTYASISQIIEDGL